MNGINMISITGNLTQEAELKTLPSGTPVCNFIVAADRYIGKDASGKAQTESTFFKCAIYGKYAEVMAPVLGRRPETGKFRKVTVTGEIIEDKPYQKKDGSYGRSPEVRVDRIHLGSTAQVIVQGNIGADAELRYTNSGIAVCNISVAATTYAGTDPNTNERRERTVWFRATLWRSQAEGLWQYLKKGSRVTIIGEYKNSEPYQSRDGEWRVSNEIQVSEIVLNGGSTKDASYDDDPLAFAEEELETTTGAQVEAAFDAASNGTPMGEIEF